LHPVNSKFGETWGGGDVLVACKLLNFKYNNSVFKACVMEKLSSRLEDSKLPEN